MHAPNQELDKFKYLDNLLRSEGPYFLTIIIKSLVVDIHTSNLRWGLWSFVFLK